MADADVEGSIMSVSCRFSAGALRLRGPSVLTGMEPDESLVLRRGGFGSSAGLTSSHMPSVTVEDECSSTGVGGESGRESSGEGNGSGGLDEGSGDVVSTTLAPFFCFISENMVGSCVTGT